MPPISGIATGAARIGLNGLVSAVGVTRESRSVVGPWKGMMTGVVSTNSHAIFRSVPSSTMSDSFRMTLPHVPFPISDKDIITGPPMSSSPSSPSSSPSSATSTPQKIPLSPWAQATLANSPFLSSLRTKGGDEHEQTKTDTKSGFSLTRLFSGISFFTWLGNGSIDEPLTRLGFEERKMAGDGNCMFRAIADQLYNNQEKHTLIRGQLVSWLRGNGGFDVSGRNDGTELQHFLEKERFPSWTHYCDNMSQNGAWGDHIMLKAASEVYRARIFVVSAKELQKTTPKDYDPEKLIELVAAPTVEQRGGEALVYKEFFLSHWPEVHYNSLRRLSSPPSSLSLSPSATPSPPSTPTLSPTSSPPSSPRL